MRVGWERCRLGERDGSNLAEVVACRTVEKLGSCQLQADRRCPQRRALEAAGNDIQRALMKAQSSKK